MTSPIFLYPHRTSAYLQSLAEICHAILWDARWRVGGARSLRLFEWEKGDDMSALHMLGRRYFAHEEPLLVGNNARSSNEATSASSSASCEHNQQRETKGKVKIDEDKCDPDDRCLETYARLYFRKGPWFRLDNIYTSYYLPQKHQIHERPLVSQLLSKTEDVSADCAAATGVGSCSSFFARRKSEDRNSLKSRPEKTKVANANDYIDREYVDLQIEAVVVLLEDIKRLFQMGLIRSFHNEEECGRTIGKRNGKYDYTAVALLRQDEQRTVLAKLGGGQKQKQKQKAANLIWKQMSQQQTIFHSFNNCSRTSVLPVIKHVHRLLIEKWASSIVLKASKVEYVPSTILRSETKFVCDALLELASEMRIGSTIMCLRLREAPLQTLRRACRLYLCATSGPGDMRNSGTNAWRSFPDSHVKDLQNLPLKTNVVSPPGSSWNTVCYPGKDWRLRIVSCPFIRAYKPAVVEEFCQATVTTQDETVFPEVLTFNQWELGVEVRENCDYLLELNDMLLYNERKRARESQSGTRDDFKNRKDNLLTIAGRAKLVKGLLAVSKEDCATFFSEIERDVSSLLGTGMPQFVGTNRLENDCERILGVIGIILTHVLEYRNLHDRGIESKSIFNRPWLRHMYWEGCMSYVLWDVIPLLERRGYYNFAINALEVLLFGKRLPRFRNKIIPENFCDGSQTSLFEFDYGCSHRPLISRRARGKAFDRLVIDYTHFVRKNKITTQVVESKNTRQKSSKGKRSTKHGRNLLPASIVNQMVKLLTEPILQACVPTGQITFSSIRTLARRLKRPLSNTLEGLHSIEATELGHRMSNGDNEQQDTTKYNDWTPIFDAAVANAMGNDRESTGGRCSFIGFEDDDHAVRMGSLNVEELATEYYHQGRLPVSDDSTRKGGWHGYHDEGGKIRVLFRILSSGILGMDWESTFHSTSEASTIHLTPYQGAPFDLHVGAERIDPVGLGGGGIYWKRKPYIDDFLEKISSLDGEDLSDFVHGCIHNRVQYTNSVQRLDPTLNSDLKQTRTLSMIAAGLGGKMLSAIFRCLFFDYRHYSGGLPDLLLVRALYSSSTDDQSTQNHRRAGELVDLGEWVGEEFSSDHQEAVKAKQIAQIFIDTDGDFLGCSKVGDSGGRSKNRFQRSGQSRNSFRPNNSIVEEGGNCNCDEDKPLYSMPEKLHFCHDSRQIKVECMFVEVKSQNDRLDSRQEDWLNILDQYGNARVCKFGKVPITKSTH
eukprot:jgi/Psemu1/216379/e_gw1.793.34.1